MQACGWESVQCAVPDGVVSRETLASRPAGAISND